MRSENERQDTGTELVRQLLKEAFPSVDARSDLRRLTHSEAVRMRTRLASLRNEDLPYYLRQILEDLLTTHTGRAGESEDAEAVIQHLNVLVKGTDISLIRGTLGADAADQALLEEKYLRAELAESYSSFSPQQASAIVKWLELAKSWEDLKWYGDELNAALLYWRQRSRPSGGSTQSNAPIIPRKGK